MGTDPLSSLSLDTVVFGGNNSMFRLEQYNKQYTVLNHDNNNLI